MPRFKHYNYDQTELLPISFDLQIVPGTFEYTLSYLIDYELDTTIFHHKYQNDETGRPAYDPAILLKVILLAYARGITSSRKIQKLCRENVIFMALSANTHPHFTTIADFISGSSEEISQLFLQVLMVCDSQGLIGKEMFAIDGCKIPSNASKSWSGTHQQLKRKKEKMEAAIKYLLKRHTETDQENTDDSLKEKEQQQIEKLQKASAKIKHFLETTEDKPGKKKQALQSNITDNESAQMKTSHGMIQGYTAIAAVDTKHQVIVAAEAFGTGQEHGLLEPMLEAAHENLEMTQDEIESTKISADAGYHNQDTLLYLDEHNIDGYIADQGMRSRDPRFADYKKKYKPIDKSKKPPKKFTREDFQIDLKNNICICPAGKVMPLDVAKYEVKGFNLKRFRAKASDCQSCHLRAKCLRTPQQKTPKSININLGAISTVKRFLAQEMRDKIDSVAGKALYSLRLGTVEPVFGHLTSAIGIKRFSLRGKKKVNTQWQLMALLHNSLKLHRFGKLC